MISLTAALRRQTLHMPHHMTHNVVNLPMWSVFTGKVAYQKSQRSVHICKSTFHICEKLFGHNVDMFQRTSVGAKGLKHQEWKLRGCWAWVPHLAPPFSPQNVKCFLCCKCKCCLKSL